MPPLLALALAPLLGCGIGLSLGAVGAGGSILAVPMLVYVLGESTADATTSSLLIVAGIALIAALEHLRAGTVDLRTAALVAATGAPGAVAGAAANRHVPSWLLLVLFALLLLLVVAVTMLAAIEPVQGERRRRWPAASAAGVLVGLLTGFFGVGGGFLILPALVFFAGVATASAVGTSLAVISCNSSVGFASHAAYGGVHWLLAAAFGGGGIAGAVRGARLAGELPAERLRRWFALLAAAVAVFVLVRVGA